MRTLAIKGPDRALDVEGLILVELTLLYESVVLVQPTGMLE